MAGLYCLKFQLDLFVIRDGLFRGGVICVFIVTGIVDFHSIT